MTAKYFPWKKQARRPRKTHNAFYEPIQKPGTFLWYHLLTMQTRSDFL